jgi:hypothetical protein
VQPGRYILQCRPPGGHVRLPIAIAAPLRVASVKPRSGASFGGDPIVISFAPEQIVPLWDLTVDVSGNSYPVDDHIVRWDADAHALRFAPAAAGLTFADRDEMTVSLIVAGHETPLAELRYVFRRRRDRTPPTPVRVTADLVFDSFETGLGGWQQIGRNGGIDHGAWLKRDHSQAAAGDVALKLFNSRIGGIAGARAYEPAFSAARFPILSFDCRMEEEMMLYVLLQAQGRDNRVRLTDSEHNNPCFPLGRFDGFAVDSQWHRVEVNLHDLLAAQPHREGMFQVANLRVADGGWTGNRKGATCWIDNFRIAPVLPAAAGVTLTWQATDPGGIAGYSYRWTAEAEAAVDKAVDAAAATATFADVPEGRQYFHIRAVDQAGNWSETSHWLYLIDATPPVTTSVAPAPDNRSGSRIIKIGVRDAVSGVDPASIALTINGQPLPLSQPGVALDLAAGSLVVDWPAAGVTPAADGRITVALAAISDFAGNTGEAVTWSWTFDAAADVTPPLAPEITWVDGAVATQLTFRPTTTSLSGAPAMWHRQVLDPGRGNWVQRVEVGTSGIRTSSAVPGNASIATHRYLSFRYRFPPGLKLDLGAHVTVPDLGTHSAVIELTDADVRPDIVVRTGRIDGIRCDNQWHHALIDLQHVLTQRPGTPDVPEWAGASVRGMRFADLGFNGNPLGTVYAFDDIVWFGAGPTAATFSFRTHDESGIAGYACAISDSPSTVPEEKVTAPADTPYAATFPGPGTWYLHVRAADNAGNWSATSSSCYVVAP